MKPISVSYTCWYQTILLPLKTIQVIDGVDNLEVALEGRLAFKRLDQRNPTCDSYRAPRSNIWGRTKYKFMDCVLIF
jgi:hypothetical protein